MVLLIDRSREEKGLQKRYFGELGRGISSRNCLGSFAFEGFAGRFLCWLLFARRLLRTFFLVRGLSVVGDDVWYTCMIIMFDEMVHRLGC
ncbi:hypothetical protein AKJ16_DCAP09999 [Drosera capensis]